MSSDTLREQLEASPFRPLVLTLTSGRTVTVANPDAYAFSETGRTLFVWQGERPVLLDVTLVEAVDPAGEPAGQG